MHVCMYMCVRVCVRVYMYVCACEHVRVCIYVHVSMCVRTCMCICTCVHAHVYVCVYTCVYMHCVYVCAHVCIFVCIYIHICIYNEYFSVIKENEVLPFAAISRMDLEILILSEVRQRKTNTAYHLYVESKKIMNLKANVSSYRAERDSQTYKTNFWLSKGKGGGERQIRSQRLTDIHYHI